MGLAKAFLTISQSKRVKRAGLACSAGFTLVELLAVVVVILILAGLCIRVASYVQTKVGISTTRAQISMIQAALEMYKADKGYYPPTITARISANGLCESSNNAALYYALSPMNSIGISNDVTASPNTNIYYTIIRQGRKVYLRFPPSQVRTNPVTLFANVYDAWGKPIVYYNSPQTAFSFGWNNSANTGYMLGGQVNVSTYDLFSFGPDGCTQIASTWPAVGGAVAWTSASKWTNVNSSADDIANWNR